MTFDDHVRAALDELPADLAAALENVAVVVEDENPEDPDLLGLYHGVPLTGARRHGGRPPGHDLDLPHPARGVVSRIRGELREEIRITVLHELGHYFGLDEDADRRRSDTTEFRECALAGTRFQDA